MGRTKIPVKNLCCGILFRTFVKKIKIGKIENKKLKNKKKGNHVLKVGVYFVHML